ncbi:MAG: T9SS type A sorting domain-containing protein, partial [Chitinispirillaceae bacterium]|nr:T9SS type A sorting domain-containing protein [Chitinispirillaceae bacterium]
GASLPRPRIHQTAGRIGVSNVAKGRVGIFTVQGRRVASAAPAGGRCSFDARGFPAGLYYVKVTSGNRVAVAWKITVVK